MARPKPISPFTADDVTLACPACGNTELQAVCSIDVRWPGMALQTADGVRRWIHYSEFCFEVVELHNPHGQRCPKCTWEAHGEALQALKPVER